MLLCSGGVEDVHQFLIPVPHLPARVPERAVHAYEVAPSAVSKRALEVFSVHRVAPLDVELLAQLFVQRVVPSDVVAEVEDGGFGCLRRGSGASGAPNVLTSRCGC